MTYKIFHFSKGGEIFKKLDLIKQFPNVPTKVVLFMYDPQYDLSALFSELKPEGYNETSFPVEYEDKEASLLNFKIRKNGEKNEEKDIDVFFIISKVEPFAAMITNVNTYNMNQKVLRYFNKFYPFLSRIFFRSQDIKELLESIEKSNQLNIFVKSYVVKRYYEKPEIEVCYEKTEYQQVFKKATENYLWVDSLQLYLEKNKALIGRVRIGRNGVLSFSGMDYSMAYSLFITNITSKYSERYLKVLKHRSRNLENLEPRPIRFNIADDVFNETSDVDQLIEMMQTQLKGWGYSVLYKEGPYVFIMLHDYMSGSSYEILICSKSEIFVTPQTQVTPISFNSLINFLMDNYDGSVEDA